MLLTKILIFKKIFQMRLHNYLLVLLITVLLACNKEKNIQSNPEIVEFKLEASLNSKLITTDIHAKIESSTITFQVPEAIILKDIIPTFIANTDDIQYKNAFLKSGKTTLSLVDNDIIKIKLNNIEKNYTIKIQTYTDASFTFESFIIEKSKNPSLNTDIVFSKIGDTLTATTISFDDIKLYIPSFTTTADKVILGSEIISSGLTGIRFNTIVPLTLISKSGFKKEIYLQLKFAVATIPHIYINTVNNAPVVSKDDYLSAGIEINGFGQYQDYKDSTQIKGRGNSTWSYAKKPYRLKLKTKASLFGLSAEKDWVLLANYLDPTLMLNATALKMGELLDVPFPNHTIAVELTINGVYQGAYTFTEQVEVETNRVNVKDGVLFELDSYFDEDYKFKSSPYNLPVNIKYPDLKSSTELDPIKNNFNSSVSLLNNASFPNNNYLNYFDSTSFVNYILVYWLTDNRELNHPKSSYMHLKNDGKYYFGPIWDFDWAYGYEGSNKHFSTFNASYFNSVPISYGTTFFKRFLDDPKIKAKVKRRWVEFRNNDYSLLTNYVTYQGNLIKTAYDNNNKLWKKSGTNTSISDAQRLVAWLQNRANYLDQYIQSL